MELNLRLTFHYQMSTSLVHFLINATLSPTRYFYQMNAIIFSLFRLVINLQRLVFTVRVKGLNMGLILQMMKSTASTAIRVLAYAFAKAYIPRCPPRNWSIHEAASRRSASSGGRLSGPRHVFSRIIQDDSEAFNRCPHSYDERMQNRGHSNSAHSANMVKPAVADFEVQIHVEAPDRGETTICDTDESVTADFSIYSDASSPDLNKAGLITSPSPSLLDVKEGLLGLLMLQEASERVTEILRENRRRLDSGEDMNISRREARRKRAQELCAMRNTTRTYLF